MRPTSLEVEAVRWRRRKDGPCSFTLVPPRSGLEGSGGDHHPRTHKVINSAHLSREVGPLTHHNPRLS